MVQEYKKHRVKSSLAAGGQPQGLAQVHAKRKGYSPVHGSKSQMRSYLDSPAYHSPLKLTNKFTSGNLSQLSMVSSSKKSTAFSPKGAVIKHPGSIYE